MKLTITDPGTLMPVVKEAEISEGLANQIIRMIEADDVVADEPLVIPARTLSNAETADIAVTAAEGGINYWCKVVGEHGYQWQRWTKPDDHFVNREDLPDDFVFYRIRYENPTDDGMLETDITPTLIRQGIAAIVTKKLIRDDLTKQVLDAVRGTPDDVDIDADGADCIVQAGIFGEVVFG